MRCGTGETTLLFSRNTKRPRSRCASVVVLLLLAGVGTYPAQRVWAQVRVTAVATSLNHVSVIQLDPAESVERVAVGANPSELEVQWTGSFVLVKPLQPHLSTNLVVFTNKGDVYSYEILPASSPRTMTTLVRQYDATLFMKDKALSAAEKQERQMTDTRNTALLLQTRVINSRAVSRQKTGIAVRVDLISSDQHSDYVRFTVTNDDSHSYRLQLPQVVRVQPVSAAGYALAHRYTQLSPAEFSALRGYVQSSLSLSASTLTKLDLLPNSTVDFTIAFPKPKKAPGIYRFAFAKDYGAAVTAYAVF